MAQEPEIVYLGHDNTVDLVITVDGQAIPITALTKVELVHKFCGGPMISSIDHLDWFDWTTRGSEGVLTLRLGDAAIAAGAYTFWLKLYDAINTDGIVWSELKIKFIDTICPIL